MGSVRRRLRDHGTVIVPDVVEQSAVSGMSSQRSPSALIIWGAIAMCATLILTVAGIVFLAVPRAPDGAPGVSSAVWADPEGDVTLANADVVGGSITVWAGMIDIRARFVDSPYRGDATHHVTWCLDTDSDPATGDACGSGGFIGADEGFTLVGDLNAFENCNFTANGFLSELEIESVLWYDAASYTLRILVPTSVLNGTEAFRYIVESAFGGSFGANDVAPQHAGFSSNDGSFSSEIGYLPFAGSRPCAT